MPLDIVMKGVYLNVDNGEKDSFMKEAGFNGIYIILSRLGTALFL